MGCYIHIAGVKSELNRREIPEVLAHQVIDIDNVDIVVSLEEDSWK